MRSLENSYLSRKNLLDISYLSRKNLLDNSYLTRKNLLEKLETERKIWYLRLLVISNFVKLFSFRVKLESILIQKGLSLSLLVLLKQCLQQIV